MNTLTAVSLLLTLGACYSAVVQPVYSGDKFELLILHNNDMHAKFEQTSQRSGACTVQDREAGKCYGGFPRVAHVVKEARRKAQTGEGPPVLYLNAGDTYTGTAWFTIYKWRIAAEFINALQPDAVSLGNHEFDENIDGLIPFIRNVSTPVLASNLILNKVPELAREENLKRSIVLMVEGKKIAIIGYLTAETKFLAPKNEVEYIDEVDAIQAEVNKYKQEGVNIFIALGHSGFVKDLEIARKVIGLDLVIGGHSNTFLWNGETKEIPETPDGHYPYEVKQASGKVVRVVQAYAYTKYMGLLRLSFNERGDIIECSGEPILLDYTVPQDPEVEKIVEKYKYKIDLVNNVIVGTSMVTLDREYCRVRECNIGSLITDAVLNYTQSENESYQANIAFVQGGRIRTSLDRPEKPFNMTRGDWLNVIPFDDPLTLVSVDGKTLKEALEHSVSNWRLIDSPGSFLQVSGMEVVYDLANSKGSRVVNARAVCSKCKTLEPVKDDDQYKILMSSFLADGGDGFAMFEGLDKEILNYNEIDCIINYLSKIGPVAQTEMGRITVNNENVITNNFLRSSQMVVLPSSLLSCIALLFLQYFI